MGSLKKSSKRGREKKPRYTQNYLISKMTWRLFLNMASLNHFLRDLSKNKKSSSKVYFTIFYNKRPKESLFLDCYI